MADREMTETERLFLAIDAAYEWMRDEKDEAYLSASTVERLIWAARSHLDVLEKPAPSPYALAADALESLWRDGREDILCRDTMQWAIDHLRAMGEEKE